MDTMEIQQEIGRLINEFGANPLGFFWVLHDSPNENVDGAKQNERWAFIKAETWHSLDLTGYYLWAISDNGDLLWWNGERVIAMAPRDMEFFSAPVGPTQFIRLINSGKKFSPFPDDL